MHQNQTAFQIDKADNVATALTDIVPGRVSLLGDASGDGIEAREEIARGHKIALRDLRADEDVVKYGIVIGRMTKDAPRGAWIHLHCMRSCYDEKSATLDPATGVSKETRYV